MSIAVVCATIYIYIYIYEHFVLLLSPKLDEYRFPPNVDIDIRLSSSTAT